MKSRFLVLLIASSAFGQGTPAVPAAACGPGGVGFALKFDPALHAMKPPESNLRISTRKPVLLTTSASTFTARVVGIHVATDLPLLRSIASSR